MGCQESTGTKDRALKPVSVRVYMDLLTIFAGYSDVSTKALEQMLRFGPAALPLGVLNGHVTLHSSRGRCHLTKGRSCAREALLAGIRLVIRIASQGTGFRSRGWWLR